LCIIIVGATYYSFAQDNTINIYYDSTWQTTSADNAFFRRKFTKVKNYYSCFTFWAKNNILYSKSLCLDISAFPKRIGLFQSYYENGQLKDSMRYLNNGTLLRSYKYFETGEFSDSVSYDENEEVVKADHYYTNGKPLVHFFRNEQTNKVITEAYDEKGEKNKNFIYAESAAFPGENGAWKKYLEDVNYSTPFVNNAPKGKYKVIVNFTINETGDVTDVKCETNYGYGMEAEVIRVVKASPRRIRHRVICFS